MIQLCGDFITLPLAQIFQSSLNQGVFSDTWKMSYIILVSKKGAKYLVKNNRSVRLLPIFTNAFERLLFNSLFSQVSNNNLFTKCQTDFMPGDSCISQLLSIVLEIQSSFHYKLPADVRAIFLDISKALDKAWHQGLLLN